MYHLRIRELELEHDLIAARRRAGLCLPSSPAWDAAMAMVDDLERQLWVVERMRGCPAPVTSTPGSWAPQPHGEPAGLLSPGS